MRRQADNRNLSRLGRREPSMTPSELAPPPHLPPEEAAKRDVRAVLDRHDDRLRQVLSKLKVDA